MADNRDTEVGSGKGSAADSGAARIVTRRRLMLGAAAVLPSVVTLRSGAQSAAQSFACVSRGKQPGAMLNNMGVPRFTDAPDEWLRKKVFSGQAVRAGLIAYCTTWDQPSILAIASLQKTGKAMTYQALSGTTWSTGPGPEDSIKIGTICPPWESGHGAGIGSYCYAESIEDISASPDHWALVFVDETGLSTSLEPGPGMVPVRATCFASLMGARGTNLG
jgi:hypothetical protein